MNLTSPKNWKTTTLEEIAEIVGGGTPSTKESSFWDGDIPWITPKDLSGYQSVYIEGGERHITEEGLKNSSVKLLPKNSILFSSRAPIGYIAINKIPVTTNQGFKSLIPKEGTDYRFLYYWLSYNKENIEKQASGSTFAEVSGSVMKNIEITLPETIEEQHGIAAILGSLDDKIELLRAQNKTLESIAQTLFREWFVDFRFPGHEGMKVVDGVPGGWRVGRLGEFINLRGGLSYDGNLISDKGVPMLTMGFVSGSKRFEWSGLRFYKGSYKNQNKVMVGDLVIATRDVTQDRILIGSPALIPNLLSGQDIIAATNLYIVENINYLTNKFIYWLMKTPDYRERIVGACKGTTIVMITKDSILDYEFVVPPESIAKKFDEINNQIIAKCEMIDSEFQTLSKLRDDLLNNIFSN